MTHPVCLFVLSTTASRIEVDCLWNCDYLKFTSWHGSVTSRGTVIRMEVIDSGSGLSEENQWKLLHETIQLFYLFVIQGDEQNFLLLLLLSFLLMLTWVPATDPIGWIHWNCVLEIPLLQKKWAWKEEGGSGMTSTLKRIWNPLQNWEKSSEVSWKSSRKFFFGFFVWWE
jgi:hypothetical protein